MKRIFVTLAAFNALALLVSFGLGLPYLHGDWARSVPLSPQQPLGTFFPHFVVGLSTAVLTLFVHCLIFTYFLGTGRWVKEVSLAYGLPDQDLPRQTRELKRRTFPPALFAMLSVIATAAAGAGAQMKVWPWEIHFLLAILTLLFNFWAFWVEFQSVTANGRIMDQVMDEVHRLRGKMPTDPPSSIPESTFK
jgi:hypothetical protein